jgi:nucleoside-diphosphate-sugar epimerase
LSLFFPDSLSHDTRTDRPTVSRNNIDATQNVLEECVRSGVRRLVFASSNHTQAADFFSSLDPVKSTSNPLLLVSYL